jgi:hypothetical protein
VYSASLKLPYNEEVVEKAAKTAEIRHLALYKQFFCCFHPIDFSMNGMSEITK